METRPKACPECKSRKWDEERKVPWNSEKEPKETPVPQSRDGVEYGPKWEPRTRGGVNRNPYGPCRKCRKRHNPQNKCPKSDRQKAQEELKKRAAMKNEKDG